MQFLIRRTAAESHPEQPGSCRSWPLSLVAAIVLAAMLLSASPSHAQFGVIPSHSMLLDANGLGLAESGNFSSIINGSPFQQEALLSHNGYQYATWYRNGADQDILLSRRDLNGTTWETIDTGHDMDRGDVSWNSHNVVSLGISSDGRVHLSYDQHNQGFRYLTSDVGFATSDSSVWNQASFNSERDSLNSGGSRIPQVTYPRFTNVGDDFVFTYRARGSGNGDVRIAEYDSQSGQWSNTRFVNRGDVGTYDDVNNNPSTRRNAYHNGFHSDSSGRLHTTWTWRERTQDGNHDINYAYSDDRGVTWRNTNDQLVGTNSSPITVNSPGIEVVDLDRRQGLLNQQGQAVDHEGGVHVLMFHRLQDRTYTNSPFSDRNNSAYHHYYRDPISGEWDVNLFPAGERVGSRPRLGVDGSGNLFGLYTDRNDLVIAGAERTATGYADWEILHRDNRHDYDGTPLIDTQRLRDEGILSVYIQEDAPRSPNDPTSNPLRVLDFITTTPDTPSIVADPSDGSLRFHKGTGAVDGSSLGFVTNSTTLNVGQSGTAPYDRAAVIAFQLPDLGAIDDPFQTASFQARLTETVTTSDVNGDLYGIDRRETPEIVDADYYGLTDVPDPDATLLQDDLLVEGMAVDATFSSSGEGNANLIDFLNEQYAGGEGIGDFVFLRLNTDSDTTRRWSVASGNAADEDHRPRLVFRALEGSFLDGDYNQDGVVDAADFTIWRDNVGGLAGSLPNDPNGGVIGDAQYATWRDNFGATLESRAQLSVPEPASLLLLSLLGLGIAIRRVA